MKAMNEHVEQLRAEFLRLTREFIEAGHEAEIAAIEARPSSDDALIQAWLIAEERVEAANSERSAAMKALRQAMFGHD